MKALALVAAGGALGAVLRYLLALCATRVWPGQVVPWGTLIANVVGCLVLGLLVGLAESRLDLSPEVRWILFVGLLGGFTTFSAFGLETFTLWRQGLVGLATLYVFLQIGLGLAAVGLGHTLGRIG